MHNHPTVIWRSEYEMPAQCGDTSAADVVYVTAFSDGTVMADYSPYTGKELNKDFANAEQAAEWIRDYFRNDDLTEVTGFDFLTDLDN